MKTLIQSLILTSLAFAASSQATMVVATYDVTDATSRHGLWTNNVYYDATGEVDPEDGARFFQFQAGTQLTQFDDGTAQLTGSAAANGVNWTLNIMFSDYSLSPDGSVKDGGCPSGGCDLSDWEFYHSVEGIISTVFGGDAYEVAVTRTGPAMQMGTGANDKNGAFGASTWLTPTLPTQTSAGHWDLNMNLAEVPEPELLGLLSLALLMMVVRRRTA